MKIQYNADVLWGTCLGRTGWDDPVQQEIRGETEGKGERNASWRRR